MFAQRELYPSHYIRPLMTTTYGFQMCEALGIMSEMHMDFVLWASRLSGKRQIIIAESNFTGSISNTGVFLMSQL